MALYAISYILAYFLLFVGLAAYNYLLNPFIIDELITYLGILPLAVCVIGAYKFRKAAKRDYGYVKNLSSEIKICTGVMSAVLSFSLLCTLYIFTEFYDNTLYIMGKLSAAYMILSNTPFFGVLYLIRKGKSLSHSLNKNTFYTEESINDSIYDE